MRLLDSVKTDFSNGAPAGNIRLEREGGGPLYDIGIYRINAARSLFRAEPTEVVAWSARSGQRTTRRTFAARDQFAPELIHFLDCVLRGREPEPSGVEGLADVRIIRALLRSARDGKPVRLAPFRRRRRPEMSLEIHRPARPRPRLVRA